MAANDELPRGWSLTENAIAPAGDVGILLPATPGVAHVLDNATAKISFNVAAALQCLLYLYDGAVLLNYDLSVAQVVGGGGAYTEVDLALVGSITGTAGNSMTILAHTTTDTDCYFAVAAQGHDV